MLEPGGRGEKGPRKDTKDVAGAVHQKCLSRIDTRVPERASEARRSRPADALGGRGEAPSSVPESIQEPRRQRRIERRGDHAQSPAGECADAPALGLLLQALPVELGRAAAHDRVDVGVPQHAREVRAEREVQDEVKQQVLGCEHEAPPLGGDQRARATPERLVIDLDDALEAQIARGVPVKIDPRPLAHELGEASRLAVAVRRLALRLVSEGSKRRERGDSVFRTHEQVDVRHRSEPGLGVDDVGKRHALQGERLDSRLPERRGRLAPVAREHRVRRPDAARHFGEPPARRARQTIEQAEALEMGMKKRCGALASRELDEARPVDGAGGERRELGVRLGPWMEPRAQQQQSRLGTERGARGHGHGRYDVVLVRLPLPMLVR